MKRQRVLRVGLIVVGVLAVVTIGGNLHWIIPVSPQDVRVELTGTPGQKVSGTYTADDVTHTFDGTVPTAFQVHARRLQYTISRADQPGKLSGTVFINGTEAGSAVTEDATGYVRGSVVGSNVTFQTAGDGKAPAEF